MKRHSFLAVCLFLAACLNVDNFGVYWDKANIDPMLKGSWFNPKTDDCIVFLPEGANYRFSSSDAPQLVRTLMIGGHRFLMMKKDVAAVGGTMVRYDVTGDRFVMFNLESTKKEEFQAQYGNPNIAVTNTVTIKKLDASVVEVLQKISDDPSYWTYGSDYQRKDCNP